MGTRLDSSVLHRASLLRTVSRHANERVHVQNVRDFSQPKHQDRHLNRSCFVLKKLQTKLRKNIDSIFLLAIFIPGNVKKPDGTSKKSVL